MTNLSVEAIIALWLLIAVPPGILAYLQWNNSHRLRLPYHVAGGPSQYHLNVFINDPYFATTGFSREHPRTSSDCIIEAPRDNF
ncbi:hypothetical protein CGCTS75_v004723 [Colletotrichum tropicale]|nr:hypothetical protein CGCTS75_v004723 [Colletotrichum tropicale]